MSANAPLYDQVHSWLTAAVQVTGAEAGCFHLKSRSGDRVICQAVTDGLKATHLAYGLELSGCPAIAEVLTTGRALAIDHAPLDLRVAQVARERFGLKSVLYQPIRIDGSLAAVAVFSYRRRHHSWTRDEIEAYQHQAEVLEQNLLRVRLSDNEAGSDHARLLTALPGVIGLVDSELFTHVISQAVDQQDDLGPQHAAFSVSELIRDSDRGHEFRAALLDLVAGDLDHFEAMMRTGHGTWWVHARAMLPPPGGTERPMALVHVLSMPEATEALYIAQERARLEALGRIAGAVAHEVNNSLQSIRFLTHEIEETGDLSLLGDIQGSIERAGRVTSQLLTFARQAPSEFETVELTDFVTSRLALVRRSVGPHHFVDLRLRGNAPVRLDVRQIELALINLGRNAADASPEGSNVTLECGLERRKDAEFAYLALTDEGSGMPKAVAQSIGRFQTSSKPKGMGAGIGLAVVGQVAENHGGEVEVTLVPSGGTRVSIYLPLGAGQTAPEPVEATQSEGRRVLVIDDEVMVSRMIARSLGRAGFQTTCCHSLRSAMAFFNEKPAWPSLVLLDLKLGDGSGLTFFEHARAVRPDLPVVAMTGYAEREATLTLSRAGSPLILKPFGMDALRDAMRRVMNPSEN